MKSSKHYCGLLFLVLLLFMSATGHAGNLGGPWSSVFPADEPAAYHDYPFTVTSDSLVSLEVNGDPALNSQFAYLNILDSSGSYLTGTSFASPFPLTVSMPLQPGDYTARIGKGRSDVLGWYQIDDNATPTNPLSDEAEPNNEYMTATPLADLDFSGSIGHHITPEYADIDLNDYFSFSLAEDGTLTMDASISPTLVSNSAYLAVLDSIGRLITYIILNSESTTLTAYLAAGDYHVAATLGLSNIWGAYFIDSTFAPAQPNPSSESEPNDTLATADPVYTDTIYGAYGYTRNGGSDLESSDYKDCFTVNKTTFGDITITATVADSLQGFSSGLTLYDSTMSDIGFFYFANSVNSHTWEDMAIGDYYFCLWRGLNYIRGGYQIETIGLYSPVDQIGVHRANLFFLDTNGNDVWEPGIDATFPFGLSTDVPVVGDWNGDGLDEIGVYRPSAARFYLDADGDYLWNPALDTTARFGALNDLPIIGDWNGDGVDDIGVYRPSGARFYLDADGSLSWNPALDTTARFGILNDAPVIGDWNGDGMDEIGVYRPSAARFYLDADGSLAWNPALDTTARFGALNDVPIVGDWNGDGMDEIGVYRSPIKRFYMDMDGDFIWNPALDASAAFGAVGDKPIIGKW